MVSSNSLEQNELEVAGCAGENAIDRISAYPAAKLSAKALHLAFVLAGATLLTAAAARAASAPAAPAAAPAAVAAAPETDRTALEAQIASQIASLLPEGFRLKKVELGFTPPAGATLEGVAPGVSQLRSRTFLIELRAQGRVMAYSASLDAERQVMVAAHDLAAGDPIAAQDVEPRWIEAFSAAPGALREVPAGQYVVVNPLRSGEPIYASSLTRPLAIHAGDLVTVLVKNGPVTLRTQLEARSAAAVGESATLINPESGTAVTVNVTGPKAAELVMQ